jgi:thiol reductant ABC exporter CydC subunit
VTLAAPLEAGVPTTGEARAPLASTLAMALPEWRRVTIATLLGAGAVAADIGLIAAAAWLISRAAQRPNEAALALAIVAVQCFGLSRGFLRYGERLADHDAAFRLLAGLRVRVYQQLERLAPAGLASFRRGDLLARVVRDVDSLQDVVIRVIPPFATAVLVGSATVAVMWWLLPAAAVILAVALQLAALVVPVLTGFLAGRREARFAATRGDLVAAMVDLTEGAAELIAFGAADAQVNTIRRRDAELTSISAAFAGTAGIGLALTTLLAGLASWGCLLVGVPAVNSGHMNGTTLAVITLVPLAAFDLVGGLPAASQALQRVRQAAARLIEVRDAISPVSDPPAGTAVPTGRSRLQASAVRARYPGDAVYALRGVSLSLPPGGRTAIVGASGAGKSTLAAVLVRFLDYESGSIELGGTSIARLSADDLRSVIGLVSQDPYLFDTSIGENLRMGKRDATVAELSDVLDRVGLADWVDSLPQRLDTAVGAHGARLSGGQRQRVAVARALLADFPLLVLDEPAEHLDPVTADALVSDILDVVADRSVLLITHRLAGLESFDEILVMDCGRVTERGTHLDLLDRGGRYSSLWWQERRSEGCATSRPRQPIATAGLVAAHDGSVRI